MKNWFAIEKLFQVQGSVVNGAYQLATNSCQENQEQTNRAFSEKWTKFDQEEHVRQERLFDFQKAWYLKLYGFQSESDLAKFLCDQAVILDAGCGLGYKAAWFARLAPKSLVIGMDFSESVYHSARNYANQDNLFFVRGDISDTKLRSGTISYVSCDQVIHHTEDPQATLQELSRIATDRTGQVSVYVYAKKALPRELVDSYFRERTKEISHDEMWEFSRQLTELGRRLDDLDVTITCPDIPLLGIKAGTMSIQRFIYWNFLKCFWNSDLGEETSISTNFDWYAPSNAYRYSAEEFDEFCQRAGLKAIHLHHEEACHSGRFIKSL